MKIVLGTYEGNLISWESNFATDPTGRTLQLAYAFSAHGSSVRCLAFDGSEGADVLVSGGSDETIKLYDLIRHREVGSLLEHKDGITCCKFQGTTHMLSTAQDGSLNVWRTADWLSLDSLHGAKSAINYVSIHPSGRLAVTVGRDRALHLWDITKGKHAYKTKLPHDGQQVHFNKDGSRYVVLFDHSVVVYDARTGTAVATMEVDKTKKLCDCCLFVHRPAAPASGKSKKAATPSEQEFVLIGSEGGDVLLWDMGDKKLVFATGHAKRVRCVAYCPSAATGRSIGAPLHTGAPEGINPLSRLADATKKPVTLPTDGPFVVTADSEGILKVWQFEDVLNSAPREGPVEPVATFTAAAGSRVTCMAVSGAEVTAAGVAIPEKVTDAIATKQEASGHKRKREVKPAARSEDADETPAIKPANKKIVKFRS